MRAVVSEICREACSQVNLWGRLRSNDGALLGGVDGWGITAVLGVVAPVDGGRNAVFIVRVIPNFELPPFGVGEVEDERVDVGVPVGI